MLGLAVETVVEMIVDHMMVLGGFGNVGDEVNEGLLASKVELQQSPQPYDHEIGACHDWVSSLLFKRSKTIGSDARIDLLSRYVYMK